VDKESPIGCPVCEAGSPRRDPFCPQCGRLSPRVTREGSLALEILEVPSEKVRTMLVEAICEWFPEVDRFRVYDRFRKGPSTLIAGLDDDSANRLLNSFRAMNVEAKLRPDVREPDIGLLWNSGLAASAGLLVLAYLSGGFFGLLFLLGAIAAPIAGAVARHRSNVPLVSRKSQSPDAEKWIRLSTRYSAVMTQLAQEDATSLRLLTGRVFDLQWRLRSGSLAALAAGGEGGSLHQRLREAIETAVDLSDRIASSEKQSQEDLRKDFAALVDMVQKTSDWYVALETGEIKQAPQLTQELQDITAGIDRIMEDVRSPAESRIAMGSKERA
jgi:hypothetical protein